MRIDTYSYVFSGMNPEPYYAAASADCRSVWAVADGTESGSARTVIHAVEELDRSYNPLKEEHFESAFGQIHSALRRMKASVSAAGVFADADDLWLFNIGNARAIAFKSGGMVLRSEDHSEAFRDYLSKGASSPAAYDRIRFQEKRLNLKKALGIGNDGKPQFYPPVPLQSGIAVVLCTERFWDYLSVMEMELDYRKVGAAENRAESWLRLMTRRVLMKAGEEIDGQNFAVTVLMTEE